MSRTLLGELVPVGGGDPIKLDRPIMSIGRRESCEICLRFPNVSGLHCELSYRDGYWYIRDMGSTNGIKINGSRVIQRPLRPGDQLSISNRRYTIQYDLEHDASLKLESMLEKGESLLSVSLLEKAGLAKPKQDDDD
jgi:pSer/pThr/pTyr-binding forkhead associated (FHA) protein